MTEEPRVAFVKNVGMDPDTTIELRVPQHVRSTLTDCPNVCTIVSAADKREEGESKPLIAAAIFIADRLRDGSYAVTADKVEDFMRMAGKLVVNLLSGFFGEEKAKEALALAMGGRVMRSARQLQEFLREVGAEVEQGLDEEEPKYDN